MITDSTVLGIVGLTLGEFSCRGLTMELTPIGSNQGLRRSINGVLLDLTAVQFHKYSASISCEDQEAPELTDIWQGKILTVTCIPGLGPSDSTAGSITLTMMLDTWTTSRDEWGALTNWTLNLLEV